MSAWDDLIGLFSIIHKRKYIVRTIIPEQNQIILRKSLQCKVQVPLYRGLHLALESVAVKFLNIYGTKIWRLVQFYIPLYSRKESSCAFIR
ncbi:hypothetical protein PIOMA14_II_0525 [Prevotella intermedia]|uniref:Uncharacterized protein n=1 Tax=Prevotella intermedia TaxID=28131 RepID=A0A0S3UNF9_PREIN|nr:hypothetical protein PIOMA14_II_0227 [Prevotella intermedia]BAU19030.1 hypothetical protein PIOMA14_II_0525 [Prevotella intermedia]